MRRYTPMESESLSPRIMMIPDDAVCHPGIERQNSQWSSDTHRLLKLVDEQSLEALESLLSMGASVNGHGGAFHETPLHKAAQQGWVAGLQLFLSYGATPHSTNQFGQTPLHYAAASKSVDCLKKLLDAGCQATLDHPDMRGHSPLHDAASAGFPMGVALLLKAGANTDARDKNEETPLHKAAKARCIASMLSLLNKGADMGARDKSGESVISYVLRHIPTGMEDLLDHCLVTNADKLSLKKLEVEFNFVPLAGSSELNQMKILNNVVELRHPKLLLHPVCEAFLLLKWHNVRRLFFIEVIFYFTHAILASLLILDKFVWQIVDGRTIPKAIPQDAFYVLEIMVLIQAVLILVKQVLTIIQGVRAWIFSLWHVLNGVIPMLVLLVLPGNRMFWQHHFSSITLLLIWVQCMLHIGRFPGCGIYVAMFTRVAKVFVRIFLVFFCLLLAFSLSFYVSKYVGTYETLSQNTTVNVVGNDTTFLKINVTDQVYANPVMTFIKTLTMMIGELDFDSNFVDQLGNLPGTSHIIYLAFVILVSIILSNLLVALAVNDVQGLRNSAHLERLIKQVELVFQMEKTFSSMSSFASFLNLSWLRRKIMIFVHDFGHTKVFVQPYHPQKGTKLIVIERGLMKELNLRRNHVKNVMDCLRIREEQANDRKLSVKRMKSRPIRSDYSAFSGVEEGLAESLKRVEGNILESLNERIDEVVHSISTLSERFKTLEDNFAKYFPAPEKGKREGDQGDENYNIDFVNPQQTNHAIRNNSINNSRLSQNAWNRTMPSMHKPPEKKGLQVAQSFNQPPGKLESGKPTELQQLQTRSLPKKDVNVQFEMVSKNVKDESSDKDTEL